MPNPGEVRKLAERYNQGHVFAFWDQLNEPERFALLRDLAGVDFALVDRLIESHVTSAQAEAGGSGLLPPECLSLETGDDNERNRLSRARRRGEAILGDGKVAALVVAGGQGTRLGFAGPKGAFDVSPVRSKALFQLFAESLLAGGRRFGRAIPWLVMTSPTNDAETREFFEANAYFGLDSDNVTFFTQGVMPAVDSEGRILLAEKHRLALSPDGHGGTLRALRESGALSRMQQAGIEAISYFQVDNPLVRPVNPLLLGLHQATNSLMTSLCVPKASDDERVGVFGMIEGRLHVIEYSDLPAELASARNVDGSRQFDAANIAVHVLDRAFVDRITGLEEGAATMPWHRAQKAVSYIDPETGQRVDPVKPNATKFEMFIFDALPLAGTATLVQTTREEVFSPIKNAEGSDSLATSQRDQVRRAARWLESCGVMVPRDSAGEPDCRIEISPLLANSPEELAEKRANLPEIRRGADVYLGPEAQ